MPPPDIPFAFSSDNKDVISVRMRKTFDYQGLAKTYNVVFSRSFVVMGNK